MEIGQNIRNLRHEFQLTQEELAERIGVTSQAVSKWESGAGLPDISQVVPLAGVFGVSTDAIFGTSGTDNDEEVRRLIEAAASRETRSETLADCREILKKYPASIRALVFAYNITLSRAHYCYDTVRDERVRAIPGIKLATEPELREAALECERVCKQYLAHGKGHIMYRSIQVGLVQICAMLGKLVEAREIAETLPTDAISRSDALTAMYRYSGNIAEEMRCCEKDIETTRDKLAGQYAQLADAHARLGDYEAAIDALKKNLALRLEERYCHQIALYCLKLGDTDASFEWLGKMFEAALSPEQIPTYSKGVKISEYDNLYTALNHTPELDPLRTDPRFDALLERLNTLKPGD
jgi:transcriptional regulator with XRE-family HTH domain